MLSAANSSSLTLDGRMLGDGADFYLENHGEVVLSSSEMRGLFTSQGDGQVVVNGTARVAVGQTATLFMSSSSPFLLRGGLAGDGTWINRGHLRWTNGGIGSNSVGSFRNESAAMTVRHECSGCPLIIGTYQSTKPWLFANAGELLVSGHLWVAGSATVVNEANAKWTLDGAHIKAAAVNGVEDVGAMENYGILEATGSIQSSILVPLENHGSIRVLDQKLSVHQYVDKGGEILIKGGHLSLPGNQSVPYGVVGGSGTLNGNVAVGGTLVASNRESNLKIDGSTHLNATASTVITMSRTATSLLCGGPIAIDGRLQIEFDNAYYPPATDVQLMTAPTVSGHYAQIVSPVGFAVRLRYTPTSVLARFVATCPADLNGDLLADDVDFTIFVVAYDELDCASPTMPAWCPSDLDRSGSVDDADFQIFVRQYDAVVCPG